MSRSISFWTDNLGDIHLNVDAVKCLHYFVTTLHIFMHLCLSLMSSRLFWNTYKHHAITAATTEKKVFKWIQWQFSPSSNWCFFTSLRNTKPKPASIHWKLCMVLCKETNNKTLSEYQLPLVLWHSRLGVRRASQALAVYILYRLQCFDAAGWAAGRASGL